MSTFIISLVPGQGEDYSYRYGKEHSVSTNCIPRNIQEVLTCAVLFLHYNNCERYCYPHISAPGLLELEHALEIALNKPLPKILFTQNSKTRDCLDHISQLILELHRSTHMQLFFNKCLYCLDPRLGVHGCG